MSNITLSLKTAALGVRDLMRTCADEDKGWKDRQTKAKEDLGSRRGRLEVQDAYAELQVSSSSDSRVWVASLWDGGRRGCTCPDSMRRFSHNDKRPCKHQALLAAKIIVKASEERKLRAVQTAQAVMFGLSSAS